MSVSGDPDSGSVGRCFLIFLTTVPGRTPSPELLQRHAAHLSELDGHGELVVAGPIAEAPGGLIALRVARLADAKAIADEDPLVSGGYQTFAAATWLMSNRQNGYQPDLPQEPNT